MALGIASAIGSAVGGIASAYASHKANKANIKMSREQMKFQERMSNTAHQREVADLKKAGLNPILSAGGQGASAPSGSMPTINPVDPNLGESVTSALAAIKLKKEIEQADAQIKNVNMDTSLKHTENTLRKKDQPLAEMQNELLNGIKSTVFNPISKIFGSSSAKQSKIKEVSKKRNTQPYDKIMKKGGYKGKTMMDYLKSASQKVRSYFGGK